MSREIKFRAWVRPYDENEWFMVNEAYPTSSGIMAVIPPTDYFRGASEYINDENEFKLMQYTGLKDKNGKEIYEGDIYKASGTISYQVFYKSGAVCGGKNYELSIPLGWEADECEPDTIIEGDTCFMEIIGNIYEHPELLGEQ